MGYEVEMTGRILYLPIRLVTGQPDGAPQNDCRVTGACSQHRGGGCAAASDSTKSGGQFVVVSGNRRLMAARIAGLGEVPCILLDVDAADAELIGLTENLQREDLHYFDEAECLQKYLVRSGLTQSQAAKKLGRSQSAVANKLRLLCHSARVRQALREKGLSERHARELLRVSGEAKRLAVLEEIAQRHLSVAQTERYIDNFLHNGETSGEKFRRRDARLFLERVARDAAQLQSSGVAADLHRKEDQGEIILTVPLEQPAK